MLLHLDTQYKVRSDTLQFEKRFTYHEYRF